MRRAKARVMDLEAWRAGVCSQAARLHARGRCDAHGGCVHPGPPGGHYNQPGMLLHIQALCSPRLSPGAHVYHAHGAAAPLRTLVTESASNALLCTPVRSTGGISLAAGVPRPRHAMQASRGGSPQRRPRAAGAPTSADQASGLAGGRPSRCSNRCGEHAREAEQQNNGAARVLPICIAPACTQATHERLARRS